ncbi:helix-turn-helix domain-containing protein [Paenibacillus sp. LMG 31456]|uniref:Helix-turn-helix domain-containing protein n=1 Tax=Paenibacillus foliorum TaxID=2654974 RepID=A0A972GTD1_9BACL|nr:helix-turn-helix domain-containing protein [Paenibacillus foliorum]NOU96506.1 helix-turn-helix domain-containing protein [Paenibacillus foliorum]
MLGKFQINRRSVLLTWLLSYLAVLLLPVVMSVIVYIKSSETLGNEIHQANESLLKQVREVMDNQFDTMERLNFELTWNMRVRQLFSNKYQIYPNEYLYDLHQITQDLLMYKTSYSLIDLFYIYLSGPNKVLLPDIYRDAPFAYELMHKTSSFSYDQWINILNQKDKKGFIPMVRVDESGKQRKTVAYISSYRIESGETEGTNVIMIDQSRILRSIENMELFNKGHVLILNGANQLLVSSSGESERLLLDFPFDKEMSGSNVFFWEKDGQNYEITYIQSERSKLKYLSIIPSQLFWEKAEQVRKLTYMSIIISLLGGGLLTYFFLRKNYNPVRQLVRAFSDKADVLRKPGSNEFSFIQQAVDHTLVELAKSMSERKKQHHVLRSNFVGRLLKGKLDQIPVDESLATFNMRFITDDFAVILLYLQENSSFKERIQQIGSTDPQKLMQFIITNVIEELALQHHQGFVTEIEETLVCLINFSPGANETRMQQLVSIAREAQTFLMTKYHIGLTLSISGIHSGLPGISQAYLEALDAMEYKLVMGSKEILSYDEIHLSSAAEDSDTGYYYPLQVEQQLINYVKIGDFTMARQTLDEIIERNFNRTFMSVPIARCLMLNLVSTMIKTISELGDIQDSVLIRNPRRIEKWIEQITNSETIQEMQVQMTEFLGNVCEYTSNKRQQNIQQSRQRTLDDRIHQIIEYINTNYKDPNLNISMIGSHFDMKPAYLSKLFKDHTGEGLLDSINKTRLERAKHLITDRKKNISDVAADVGFNDVNAFIRTFKKYEGITPGKYKEMKDE